MEIETTCAWCGKKFLKRSPKNKFCGRKCGNAASYFFEKQQNRIQEKCKIMVVKNIPVFPYLHPEVGSVHDAMEYTLPGGTKGCFIEKCGKRIVLREGEYRRIKEE